MNTCNYIFVSLLIVVVVSANVKVLYKLTSGISQPDMIMSLVKDCANNEVVGVRKQDTTSNDEPITYAWMESRAYETGYSYYEKFIVIDELAKELTEKPTIYPIPGPLYVGSKLTVIFTMPDPLDLTCFNLIENNAPNSIVHHFVIAPGVEVRTDKMIEGEWQLAGVLYYTDPASVSGSLTVVLEFFAGYIVRNEMNSYIFVSLLIVAVVSANVKVLYKLTSGISQPDMIMSLVKDCANNEVVGVRKQDTTSNDEPLTYAWMESRAYETGYSYYEKFIVTDELAKELTESPTIYPIPGPIYDGSKITITFTMPDPFDAIGFDLKDNNFPNSIVHHFVIDNGVQIRVDKMTEGVWQNTGVVYNTDQASVSGILTVLLEFITGYISGSVNGEFLSNVPLTAPGDSTTIYHLNWINRPPLIHSIRYDRA